MSEEDFKKNRVICTFATADGNCTLGFVDSGRARPKSLIKGNELKNPKQIELVLKRWQEKKFNGQAFCNAETIKNVEKIANKIELEGLGLKKVKLMNQRFLCVVPCQQNRLLSAWMSIKMI